MPRHLRSGIHDHHRNACRTDAERERIESSPLHPDDVHFEDERCWVVYPGFDPMNHGHCTRCGDLGCRCDAHQES